MGRKLSLCLPLIHVRVNLLVDDLKCKHTRKYSGSCFVGRISAPIYSSGTCIPQTVYISTSNTGQTQGIYFLHTHTHEQPCSDKAGMKPTGPVKLPEQITAGDLCCRRIRHYGQHCADIQHLCIPPPGCQHFNGSLSVFGKVGKTSSVMFGAAE